VAATSASEQKVCVWEAATARLIYSIKQQVLGRCLRFSPDSKLLLTDEKVGTLHLVSLKTGKDEKVLRGHTSFVFDAAFSPDGRRLVTVGDDHTTRIWDVITGQKILDLDNEHEFYAAAFSRDGLRLATGGGRFLRLWDAAILVSNAGKQDWPLRAARSAYCASSKSWADTIDSCKEALDLGATDPDVRIRRGLAYAELERLDEAEKDFRAVETDNTEKILALCYLGDVLLAEGRRDEFRNACRICADRATRDRSARASNAAAWESSLIPDVGVDLAKLVELMKQALKDRPTRTTIVAPWVDCCIAQVTIKLQLILSTKR
jgi:hypothetical protein